MKKYTFILLSLLSFSNISSFASFSSVAQEDAPIPVPPRYQSLEAAILAKPNAKTLIVGSSYNEKEIGFKFAHDYKVERDSVILMDQHESMDVDVRCNAFDPSTYKHSERYNFFKNSPLHAHFDEIKFTHVAFGPPIN